jgi:hypothetical protein
LDPSFFGARILPLARIEGFGSGVQRVLLVAPRLTESPRHERERRRPRMAVSVRRTQRLERSRSPLFGFGHDQHGRCALNSPSFARKTPGREVRPSGSCFFEPRSRLFQTSPRSRRIQLEAARAKAAQAGTARVSKRKSGKRKAPRALPKTKPTMRRR